MPCRQDLLILFKFGKRDHLQQLRNRGLLHMNSQRYFQGIDDPLRGDRFETTDRLVQPKDLRRLTIKSKNREIVITPDRLVIRLDKAPCNIYCMFGITEPTTPLVDQRNLEGDWDSFVVILNTATFLDRMCSAAVREGFQLRI